MMNKLRKVAAMMLFHNGMVAAFDECGNQIPALQIPAAELWVRYATDAGYDVGGCEISVTTNQGRVVAADSGRTIKWDGSRKNG